MATSAFLLLDSFGLVFMLYALANFWIEWRHHANLTRNSIPRDARMVSERIAATPRVIPYAKSVAPVIPFPARHRPGNLTPALQSAAATIEMRAVRKERANRATK